MFSHVECASYFILQDTHLPFYPLSVSNLIGVIHKKINNRFKAAKNTSQLIFSIN